MASSKGLMKFTDIVRDRYRGPAYGQEFTTWFAKVRHGFSTAQVPADAQVDHLVAVLESPAQELAFSFCEKYDNENSTDGLRGVYLVKHHEDKLAALMCQALIDTGSRVNLISRELYDVVRCHDSTAPSAVREPLQAVQGMLCAAGTALHSPVCARSARRARVSTHFVSLQ